MSFGKPSETTEGGFTVKSGRAILVSLIGRSGVSLLRVGVNSGPLLVIEAEEYSLPAAASVRKRTDKRDNA